MNTRLLGFVSVFVGLAIFATLADGQTPTPEDYVATVGNGTYIVAPGELAIDGRIVSCGVRPTVIDGNLDDYAAAYPGFLILNPKLMASLKTSVKMWIYSHECGHQFRGPDEVVADCFAVQRGRRTGWLTPTGIEDICAFISPAEGDSTHWHGTYRCELMRKCYGEKKIY